MVASVLHTWIHILMRIYPITIINYDMIFICFSVLITQYGGRSQEKGRSTEKKTSLVCTTYIHTDDVHSVWPGICTARSRLYSAYSRICSCTTCNRICSCTAHSRIHSCTTRTSILSCTNRSRIRASRVYALILLKLKKKIVSNCIYRE